LLRRALRQTFCVALALAGLTCRDRTIAGPGLPISGRLNIAPLFEESAAGGPVFDLQKVRAVLYLGGTPPDSIVAIVNFQGDSAVLQFDVNVQGPSQDFLLKLAAIDANGDTIFRATQMVTAFPLGSIGTGSGLTAVQLVYSAPDTAVASILLAPRDTTINSNDTLHLRVSGSDLQGHAIAPVFTGWQSRDTSVIGIDSVTGKLTAKLLHRSAWIVATTQRGVKDSTRVFVFAPVASVTLSSDSVAIPRGASRIDATAVSGAE
jgi:hypothetical protein